MKMKSEMDIGGVEYRFGLVYLEGAAFALYKMGFYHVALYNIAQMRIDENSYFPQDYRDCPCCDDNHYDLGNAYDNSGYMSYGDGAYEDAYKKTPRDIKRDRERRNTSRRAQFGLRGYKSKPPQFTR